VATETSLTNFDAAALEVLRCPLTGQVLRNDRAGATVVTEDGLIRLASGRGAVRGRGDLRGPSVSLHTIYHVPAELQEQAFVELYRVLILIDRPPLDLRSV
jgi:hypothetical protein